MTSAAPSDAELVASLEPALARPVGSLTRRPYRYATSFPLEELLVTLDDGHQLTLIFKDLAWGRLHDDACRSKPRFLYEPRRELLTYEHILAQPGLGARCYLALSDAEHDRFWLVIEKAPGVELWQVGELGRWGAVARWLAGFHLRFASRLDAVRAANPFLIDYRSSTYRLWADRAGCALQARGGPAATEARRLLDRYDTVAAALAELEPALLHGEFYPSNILVAEAGGALRVCPVDWEMAAVDPAALELAALCGGWPEQERTVLASAYHRERRLLGGVVPAWGDFVQQLDRCRLHLALQWLGWAEGWRAPPEHAHDWVNEVVELGCRLGL